MGTRPDATQILLLGSVQVRVGAQQVLLRGRKQRISVARLALAQGRPVPVSALIEDLWDDKRPKDAAHALQAQMHRLRTLLPVNIEFVNEGYRITGGTVSVDVTIFADLCERGRSYLAAGDPERAVAAFDSALSLWRGPPLTDLDDTPGLRPFVVQLAGMRRTASADRAEALLQYGRGESLITELRASLALDPLQEKAWHQLMRALWSAGQEAEALTAYAQAREAFLDILGTEPGTQLSELHDAMLSGALPEATSSAVVNVAGEARATSPVDEPVLVGRQDEFAMLERAWERSRDGVQVITLSGEPGIGKSYLAGEFVRRVAASGAMTLRGRCDSSVSVAYQPFAEMLRSYVNSAPGSADDPELKRRAPELIRVLPGLAERFGSGASTYPDGGEVDPHSTMDAITAWLAALSKKDRIVLYLDDLHWADEQTILTLRHLLRSPRQVRALIVLCLRDDRLSTDETLPLAQFVRQSDQVTHVPLARFTDDETTNLIFAEKAVLPRAGTAPTWFEDYVRNAAGGNPLFIVELTRQILMNERSDPETIPLPPRGITSVIWSRIEPLPATTRSLLQRAAVVGPAFDLPFLARLGGLSYAEAEGALRSASEVRLIETTRTEPYRFWFSHDVVRTVLYDSIPVAERGGLHAQVASLVAAESDGDVLERHESLAHHYRHSDVPDAAVRAAEHLFRAGRESVSRGALADGENLLTEALALLGCDLSAPLRCDVLTVLGSTQLRLARPDYRATLLEASRLAVSLDDAERLAGAVLANNRGWWSSTIAVDHERVAHIEAALAKYPDTHDAMRAQLLAAWALENTRDLNARHAVLEASQQAVEAAECAGDDQVLGWVLAHRYAVLNALFEAPIDCLRVNERLMETANRLGNPQMRLSAAVGLAQSSMRLGEFSIADRYLTEAAHLSEILDDPVRLWLVRGWQAMRAVVRGRFEQGEALMLETFELGNRAGQDDAFTWFAGQLFTLRMLQGRLSEVVEQVREQVDTVADGIPSWQAAMALALARGGHADEAEALLEKFAADDFAQIPHDLLRLHGLHYFTMTCEVLGRADIAAILYRLLLPFSGMVATNATIGAGPVDLHLGILARLREQDDVAEKHWRAAAMLCRRIDAQAWLDQIEQRLSAIP